MYQIVVRFLENAPAGFHGMVVRNDDDTYTILLDPNDSSDQILETYLHELNHISNNDFHKEDIQAVEAATHMGGK